MENKISVYSITYAMRGKEILKRYGINAKIERGLKGENSNGCGYTLVLSETEDVLEKAIEILKSHKIKVKEG